MKKKFLLLSFGLFFFCSLYAQKQIKNIKEYHITIGQSQKIGDASYAEPDIYYTENGDGTFTANRLTVKPTNRAADVTPPYLNECTATSVQVCWKTKADGSSSIVRFGTSADNLTETRTGVSRKLADTYYWNTVKLDNLSPDAVYYYQVESNGVTSNVCRFRTMPTADSTDKLRILFIGDHQRNEHSDYEWLLRMAKRTLDKKYGEAPLEDHVRFLLNVGDQVDEGTLTQYEFTHLYKSREVMSHLPIMTCVGNHETYKDANLALYNGHYASYGEIDYRGIKSGTANYYAYQAGRVLFVVLNSDGTTADQRMWVRRVAAAAENDDTVDFIVSLQHRPLYAEQWSDDTSPWALNEIMPILSATGKHVINCAGHHHLYARGQLTDWPVYHMISGGGVGTSASGYEQLWSAEIPNQLNRDEVQKTIDQWTYQIFEFDPVRKEMNVETYSIGNSRIALDNVLIDSFTRKLEIADMMAPPVLNEVAEVLTLPATISQDGAVEYCHSAEYQIARDENFSDIVLDRILLAEDFYDVDANYLPKNQREGKSVGTLELTNGDLYNGTYYARVRNRTYNLTWSDYSEPRTFTVSGQGEQPTLTLDKSFYRPGETITCTFTGATGAKDWIGIYEHGKTPGGNDVTSKAWGYTGNATNGTLTFTINDENEYFAVLLANDGFTPMTDRVPLLVTNNTSEEKPFSMTTDKQIYSVGEPVNVSMTNAPQLQNDWIGLYEKGVDPKPGVISPSWNYVGSSNTVQLNSTSSRNYTAPRPDGVYFVCYFQCDDYTTFFPKTEFIIGQPVILEPTSGIYTEEQPVGFIFEGAPGWKYDALCIYNAENVLVKTIPMEGETSGTIAVGNLTEGQYTAVFVTADTAISKQTAFSVKSSTKVNTLSSGHTTRPIAVYDLNGRRNNNARISIVKQSDGTAKKVIRVKR